MIALEAVITRLEVAKYVQAVLLVYTIIIVGYVLVSMVLSLRGRVPYSTWSNAVLEFLRDVSEPYLRIFRRFIPLIGPIDISPIVAILVLNLVGNGLLVPAIAG